MGTSGSSSRLRGRLPALVAGVVVGLLAVALARSGWRRDPNRAFRAFYDLVAPVYDPLMGEGTRLDPVRRELVAMLDLEPGDHVLEVSVGTGANLPLLCAAIGPAGRIYGLDISEGMLARARQKLPAISCPVELEQGLAEDLPYADDSFDAVLHLGGLNWFTDRRQALLEMARVARSGARIVVSDESPAPVGGLHGLLHKASVRLLPRLRPPVELVPAESPELRYLAGGNLYAIRWTKSRTAG